MMIDFLEEPLYSCISPVEVDPLAEAEGQDHVIFRLLVCSSSITGWNIVLLWGKKKLSMK